MPNPGQAWTLNTTSVTTSVRDVLEGTRLTVLAERLGVSTQATRQLVDEREEMGFVERARDPADARA